MAKNSRGGKRGSSASGGGGLGGGLQGAPVVTPTNVTPPTPQQIANGNILPNGGVAYDKFKNMTDDEKADVITDALGVGTPMFLDNSDIQKFAYFTGMSDKPTVVSDSQLDGMKGQELFRTVNDAYNPRTDIGYTSKDIIKQISEGDFTMYSDSGGSAHGKAIYFAANYNSSTAYGNSKQHSQVMRAKITGGKGITENKLSSDYNSALRRGDKLALACSNADSSSARNLYALAKGYTHITPSSGSWDDYHMILNRSCLTVSSKTKAPTGSSW